MGVKIHENRSKNPYPKLSQTFFEKGGRGEFNRLSFGGERFTPHLRMGLLWITHPVLKSKVLQTLGVQILLGNSLGRWLWLWLCSFGFGVAFGFSFGVAFGVGVQIVPGRACF